MKAGVTLKLLTSRVRVNSFLPSHPCINPCIHLSIKDALSPGLQWNRIWFVKTFTLTIHDLWETPFFTHPLHFLCLPLLNSHLQYFCSLLCSSSSWYFPPLKSSTLFSLPTPPVSFQLSFKPLAGPLMFATSLASAQSEHSVRICTWKSQEAKFLVVEQYAAFCWVYVKSGKTLYTLILYTLALNLHYKWIVFFKQPKVWLQVDWCRWNL